MAKYTADDRKMMEAEGVLWAIFAMLHGMDAGAWSNRIEECRTAIQKIATELRAYNDGFETKE